MMQSAGRRLAVTSWNIAAINNNPFEYWITYKENPEYEKLMINVEQFLENPGDKDVSVNKVFTEEMFSKLDTRMTGVGWKSVRSYWESDFRDRKIVSGFMKVRRTSSCIVCFVVQRFGSFHSSLLPYTQDPLLGSKRLASMPDRITNTINVEGGGQVFRPTVINMYEGDLSTSEKWWAAWEKFIFDDSLQMKGKSGVESKVPYQMLQKIKKSKYPDITTEEEADSLPLQTMCGAIFDSILVHMMNTVSSSPEAWQSLKKTMVENLNKQKVPHTMGILESIYIDSDIITLQEVSGSFIDEARSGKLGQKFHIVAPMNLDSVRDQNSVIALNRDTFPEGPGIEISSLVEKSFPENVDVPVAEGDILAITTKSKHGIPFVVASFHGDTNGLATKPVLSAVLKAMASDSKLAGHRLIFGMDANTYEKANPGKQQDVLDFGKHYVAQGVSQECRHSMQYICQCSQLMFFVFFFFSSLLAGVTCRIQRTIQRTMLVLTCNLSSTKPARAMRSAPRATLTQKISFCSPNATLRSFKLGKTIRGRNNTLKTWHSRLWTSQAIMGSCIRSLSLYLKDLPR